MANWKLKCCPRCGGDVFMDTDEGDWFAHCLQCGYTGDKKPISESELKMAVGRPLRTGRHTRVLRPAGAG
jgi:ribosomal protein S27AE